jgi:hypothetical protein
MKNINMDDLKIAIDKVRNGDLAVVFKGMFPDTPSWDRFIQQTHREIHRAPTGIPMQPLEERIINGVILRNLFYLMVRSPFIEDFPEMQEIQDTFGEVLGGEILPVSSFINFIGGEKPIAPHCDMRETVYWQCQGTAIWKIYAESPINEFNMNIVKPVAEYKLYPGDIIYVGREVGHSVVTLEPRAAIGFQFQQDNSRFEAHDATIVKHYEDLGIEIAKARY